MTAMRGLLTLVRVLGILALALVLYAWIHPARVGKWIGREPAASGSAVAGAQAPAQVQARTAPIAAVPAAPETPAASIAPTTPTTAQPAPAAQPAQTPVSPTPSVPADGAKPAPVSASQAAVAQWLGAKYHVAPAALQPLIVEADKLARTYKLSPNLIIAVTAIESNFHPYIQSEAGAQGLMQVMPRIHARRVEKFGGKSSLMDPIVSVKVGAEILRDCVKAKGSEAEALRYYFGGGASSDMYIAKVRAEQQRLNQVAAGARVPIE